MEFLNWAGQHPILTIVMLWMFFVGSRQLILAMRGKDVDRDHNYGSDIE